MQGIISNVLSTVVFLTYHILYVLYIRIGKKKRKLKSKPSRAPDEINFDITPFDLSNPLELCSVAQRKRLGQFEEMAATGKSLSDMESVFLIGDSSDIIDELIHQKYKEIALLTSKLPGLYIDIIRLRNVKKMKGDRQERYRDKELKRLGVFGKENRSDNNNDTSEKDNTKLVDEKYETEDRNDNNNANDSNNNNTSEKDNTKLVDFKQTPQSGSNEAKMVTKTSVTKTSTVVTDKSTITTTTTTNKTSKIMPKMVTCPECKKDVLECEFLGEFVECCIYCADI